MGGDDPPLRIRSRREGPALVLEVAGEIDLSTADDVRKACNDPQAARLVLDLRAVGFMDTSGIRLIVDLLRAEEEGASELVVVADHTPVLRLFDMAGLTDRLRLATTVEEALR
jgi:anti-sigma B factor antagonist